MRHYKSPQEILSKHLQACPNKFAYALREQYTELAIAAMKEYAKQAIDIVINEANTEVMGSVSRWIDTTSIRKIKAKL